VLTRNTFSFATVITPDMSRAESIGVIVGRILSGARLEPVCGHADKAEKAEATADNGNDKTGVHSALLDLKRCERRSADVESRHEGKAQQGEEQADKGFDAVHAASSVGQLSLAGVMPRSGYDRSRSP
jgi:hypothetical protein